MNKILIIDDDRELCALIKRSVQAENIEADFCNTGKEGLQKLKEQEYQLVVLDVMMPGMDGFETLEEIRKENSLPILMFTSKNDSISKVRGLRAGADDYLTKPFDMDELIARIASLIRRYTRFNQQAGAMQKLDFDGLQIDLENRSVTTENGTFELPPKEFDLLLYCAKHQGKILTKQQIYATYVLMHTFAHLLIKQMSMTSGYSSSAIRERIYFSEKMTGILLYTGSADKEGSLGGLVELGNIGKLVPLMKDAFQEALLCTNDTRKKASMSQVLADIKPYITKKFMAAPCIKEQDIQAICQILLPRYKNVQLMQGMANNKPDFRIQVKGLFGTEEKRFEVVGGDKKRSATKKKSDLGWIDRLEEIDAALDDF